MREIMVSGGRECWRKRLFRKVEVFLCALKIAAARCRAIRRSSASRVKDPTGSSVPYSHGYPF